MTILINVINQELRLATPFKTLVNGTQEFIKFKFVLDDAWLKITTFAQFIQDDTAYNVYLDDNKCVFLPREINSGTFTLMLYGTGEYVIGTSNYLTLKMIDNIFVGDAQSTKITESLYTQLVNIVNSYGDKIDAKVNHSEYSQLINRVNTLDNTIKDKIGAEEFESFEEEMDTKIEDIKQLIGTPVVAQSSSKMTDKTKIYIYTGDEAGYIKGNWYYYDGTKWVSGGSYGGGVSRTDKTLTQSDVPADAKATGDAVNELMGRFGGCQIINSIDEMNTVTADKVLVLHNNSNYGDGSACWFEYLDYATEGGYARKDGGKMYPMLDQGALLTSDPPVEKMMGLMASYLENDALVYGNDHTLFDAETTNEIDCSSFVSAVLHGISYDSSQYTTGSSTRRVAKVASYSPVADKLFGHLKSRYMAQFFAERKWLHSMPTTQQMRNVLQFGDILFSWDGTETAKNRYLEIGHVSIVLGIVNNTYVIVAQCGGYPSEVTVKNNSTTVGKISTIALSSGNISKYFRAFARVPYINEHDSTVTGNMTKPILIPNIFVDGDRSGELSSSNVCATSYGYIGVLPSSVITFTGETAHNGNNLTALVAEYDDKFKYLSKTNFTTDPKTLSASTRYIRLCYSHPAGSDIPMLLDDCDQFEATILDKATGDEINHLKSMCVAAVNIAGMVDGNLTSENIADAIGLALEQYSYIYIPSGEYSFNVNITDDCTIYMNEQCFISSETADPVIHAQNCSINIIGGNILNGEDNDSRVAIANKRGLIFLEDCHDSSIVGLNSPYSKSNGVIWIKDCENFVLERSTFDRMLRAAMFVCGHCVNVVVRNCKFTNSVPLSGQDYCYFVYTGSLLFTDIFTPVDGLIYENNYCAGSADSALDTHGARNVVIRNNTILNTVCAITAYNDNNRMKRPSGWKMENVLIENNYCDSTRQIPSDSEYPHPFLFIGASNYETALYDEYRNCIVRNNTFKTANNFSPKLSLGAIFTDYVSRNVIFEGNTFHFYEGADARITFRRSFGSVFRNNMVEDGTATVFFKQSLCEISGNVGFTYNWAEDSISYIKGLNNVFPEVNSPTYRTGDLFWSNGLKMCTSYGICNRYTKYADDIKTFNVTIADGVAAVANNVYIPHLALTLSEVGTAYIVDVIDATHFTLIHFVDNEKVPIPDGTYTATIRDVTMISMA